MEEPDSHVSDYENYKSAGESSDEEEEEEEINVSDRLLTAARNGEITVVKDLTDKLKRGEITLDVNCKG
jgi:hypothetical protein